MAVTSLAEFEAVIPKLPTNDQAFASSMLRSWQQYGRLTLKQMFWVEKLAARAAAPAVEPVKIASIARIRAMFDKATSKLKFPKIWLGTPESPIRMSIAGPTSRYAGAIMVTDGQRFGVNRFYGSIDREGVLTPGRDLTAEVSRELQELAADPEAKAAAFGKLTGHCCFCNTALTDERSVNVGYGPVCAKNFGLNWGTKRQAAAEQLDFGGERRVA